MRSMHVCDFCGKPTPNRTMYPYGPIGGRDGYSWCDECRSTIRIRTEWENIQEDTAEITCPWCGYVHEDSWMAADHDDDFICEKCGMPFEMSRIETVTYTSMRRIKDMPEGWCGE